MLLSAQCSFSKLALRNPSWHSRVLEAMINTCIYTHACPKIVCSNQPPCLHVVCLLKRFKLSYSNAMRQGFYWVCVHGMENDPIKNYSSGWLIANHWALKMGVWTWGICMEKCGKMIIPRWNKWKSPMKNVIQNLYEQMIIGQLANSFRHLRHLQVWRERVNTNKPGGQKKSGEQGGSGASKPCRCGVPGCGGCPPC